MTLRRWGGVHAGGESCARAGEGVTFPKSYIYICVYVYVCVCVCVCVCVYFFDGLKDFIKLNITIMYASKIFYSNINEYYYAIPNTKIKIHTK